MRRLRLLLLCFACQGTAVECGAAQRRMQAVETPDCMYEGREFVGHSNDVEDIGGLCGSHFGDGPFSVAFTAIFYPPLVGQMRVFDFGKGTREDEVLLTLNSVRKLRLLVYRSGTEDAIAVSASVEPGVPQRWLFSLSGSGRLQAFLDGASILDMEGFLVPANVSRNMLLASSGVRWFNPLFRGQLWDFWLWHSAVDWASAEVNATRQYLAFTTTTTSQLGRVSPACEFAGREYSGNASDFDDITSLCESHFGGAFSAAFTLEMPAMPSGVIDVFDFGQGYEVNNIRAYISSRKMNFRLSIGDVRGATSSVLLEAARRYRFLVSLSETGHVIMYIDGLEVVSHYNMFLPPSVSRMMYVAKSPWRWNPALQGEIRDLWIWHSDVDWTSAETTTTTTTATSTATASTSSGTSLTSSQSTTTTASTTLSMTTGTTTATSTASSSTSSGTSLTSTQSTTTTASTTLSMTTGSTSTFAMRWVATSTAIASWSSLSTSSGTSVTSSTSSASSQRTLTSRTSSSSSSGSGTTTTAPTTLLLTTGSISTSPTALALNSAATTEVALRTTFAGESKSVSRTSTSTTSWEHLVATSPTLRSTLVTVPSMTAMSTSLTSTFWSDAVPVLSTRTQSTTASSTWGATLTSSTMPAPAISASSSGTAVLASRSSLNLATSLRAETASLPTATTSTSSSSTLLGTSHALDVREGAAAGSTTTAEILEGRTTAAAPTSSASTFRVATSTHTETVPVSSAAGAVAARSDTVTTAMPGARTTTRDAATVFLEVNERGREEAANLLEATEESRAELIDDLGNATLVAKPLPQGGAMSLTRLSAILQEEAVAANGSQQTMPVEIPVAGNVGVTVAVPLSILSSVEDEFHDRLVLSVTVPSGDVSAALSSGERKAGQVFTDVAGLAVIDLALISGKKVAVSHLEEPIEFSLPTNFTPGMTCAYFDEALAAWSTTGVSLSNKSQAGGRIFCLTYHLSIFGAIVQGIVRTLVCSNFGLLSAEALPWLWRGHWATKPGSLLFFGLLLLLCLGCLSAHWHDRHQGLHWRAEFLLLEADGQRAELPAPEEDHPQEEQLHRGLIVTFFMGLASCGRLLRESSAATEALDEIVSNYVSYFAEARALLSSVLESVEEDCSLWDLGSSLGVAAEAAVVHLLVRAARDAASRAMGVTEDVVSFLLEDEALRSYLSREEQRAAFQSQQSEQGQWRQALGQQDGDFAQRQREAWVLLFKEVGQQLLQEGGGSLVKQAAGLCFGRSLLGLASRLSLFGSAKERMLFVAAEAVGALALSCAFFQAGGLVRLKGPPGALACGEDGESGFGFQLGRLLVITTASFLLAFLPVGALGCLQCKSGLKRLDYRGSKAWRRQLRVWAVQERLLWAAGLGYVAACGFYVCLFLANIDDEDGLEWTLAALLSIGQDFVAVPLMISLGVPSMLAALLFFHRAAGGDTQSLLRRASEEMHSSLLLPIVSV